MPSFDYSEPEEYEGQHEALRARDEHDQFIQAINAQFAIVTDGPRAGHIVSVHDGKVVNGKRINTLFPFTPYPGRLALSVWLTSDRREITGDELRAITKAAPSKRTRD